MPRTRDAILDAALTVAAEHGLEATRMEDVATAAGVSRQLVYYHFRSRENLLGALHGRALVALGQHLREASAAGRPATDLPAVMLQVISENQALCRLLVTDLWGLVTRPDDTTDVAERVDTDVIAPVVEWIRADPHATPTGDVTVVARALFGQVTAVALDPVVRGRHLDPATVEPVLRHLTHAALTAPAPARSPS